MTSALKFGLLALPIFAMPAWGESVEGMGWLSHCKRSSCEIVSQGMILTASDVDNSADVMAKLRALPAVSAISLGGDMRNMGDITADVTLDFVETVDNIHEGNLRMMQGDWMPDGEHGMYFVRITGLQYQEWADGELAMSALMTVGDSCADGSQHEGTVISLYQMGGDPSEMSCRSLQYIDESSMELRDLTGDWGLVSYSRVAQ